MQPNNFFFLRKKKEILDRGRHPLKQGWPAWVSWVLAPYSWPSPCPVTSASGLAQVLLCKVGDQQLPCFSPGFFSSQMRHLCDPQACVLMDIHPDPICPSSSLVMTFFYPVLQLPFSDFCLSDHIFTEHLQAASHITSGTGMKAGVLVHNSEHTARIEKTRTCWEGPRADRYPAVLKEAQPVFLLRLYSYLDWFVGTANRV